MSSNDDFNLISERIAEFCRKRDWEKFHTPKNLSMALAVEAAELMEIFQWFTPEESAEENLSNEARQKIAEEIADVVIYAIRMAQMTNVDLLQAVSDKIEKNKLKYPANLIKGKATL
jgi:NTP pyrophosphatase (non-canonical NTP hydrolase)